MTTLSSLPLDFADVATSVAAFVPAKGVLGLHATNRGWHALLSDREEELFEKLLVRDFVEGECLVHIAKRGGVPFKELYLAFLRRRSRGGQRISSHFHSDDDSSVDFFGEAPSDDEPGSDGEFEWPEREARNEENRSSSRVSIPWWRPSYADVEGGGDADDNVDGAIEPVEGMPNAGEENSGTVGRDESLSFSNARACTSENGNAATNDVSALMFIGRVGSTGNPSSCILMKFSDYDEYYSFYRLDGTEEQRRFKGQKLLVDCDAYESVPDREEGTNMYGLPIPGYGRSDHPGELALPVNERVNEILAYEDFGEGAWDRSECGEEIHDTHCVTLHVIDVQSVRVMTLMEETSTDSTRFLHEQNQICAHYGHNDDSPKIYGLPPRGSPYHRVFTDDDYSDFSSHGFPHCIAHFSIRAKLEMGYSPTESDDGVQIYATEGLSFRFGESVASNVGKQQSELCNFLRALMKEKCVGGRNEIALDASFFASQPAWMEVDKITDSIASYASFEDLAGKLRLVCHNLEAAAIRQLKQKVAKTKVIGFERHGECSMSDCFKAAMRSGWSDTTLASQVGAVNDALWLASCRCTSKWCQDKSSCPFANTPPKVSGYKVKSKELDMAWARGQLLNRGKASLTKSNPSDHMYDNWKPSNFVECSFRHKNTNLYNLCNEVVELIDNRTDPGGYRDNGERVPLGWQLQRCYGVEGNISSRQFVRSLFLCLVNEGKLVEDSAGESLQKKSRRARNDEVTIGMAHSVIKCDNGGHWERFKKIYRFYSASNEPMEICLEDRTSYDGHC